MNKSSTAYCKVCHDAGKTKAEYTSHYVKQTPAYDSKIVCPYLLSIECAYCHQKGHTPKYCNMNKKKTVAYPQKTVAYTHAYPLLNADVVSINAPILTNWSTVVSKPIPSVKVSFNDDATEFIYKPYTRVINWADTDSEEE